MEIKPHTQTCSWGPSTGALPAKFLDMPYQPFKKQDHVGKVSDWTGATYGDSRRTRIYNSSWGVGSDNAFASQAGEDANFKLVDNNKLVKPIFYGRGRGRGGFQNNRGGYQNNRFQNNRFQNQRNRGRNQRGRWGWNRN